jgi:hypothetical protein
MNSRRTYVITTVILNDDSKPECFEVPIETIANPTSNDAESIYALNDMLDDVLDLRPEEMLSFRANRDNPKHKGVIIRKT